MIILLILIIPLHDSLVYIEFWRIFLIIQALMRCGWHIEISNICYASHHKYPKYVPSILIVVNTCMDLSSLPCPRWWAALAWAGVSIFFLQILSFDFAIYCQDVNFCVFQWRSLCSTSFTTPSLLASSSCVSPSSLRWNTLAFHIISPNCKSTCWCPYQLHQITFFWPLIFLTIHSTSVSERQGPDVGHWWKPHRNQPRS